MNLINDAERYSRWAEYRTGVYAVEACQGLLRQLLSGWPRRSRSVLTLGSGSCALIETLWEAGFDVTAQDSDPDFLDKGRRLLGNRVDFVLSSPTALPFDDDAFDYVVAALALEFWEDPGAALAEMARLATGGAIIIFPNAWSVFGLECRLRRGDALCASARPLLRSPRRVARLAARAFGKKKRAWLSTLPLCSATWRRETLFRRLNSLYPPLPLAAFAGLRIDFGPLYTGTPLLLRQSEPVAPAKS
ncbi:class I SAM-dependent methyltransferase [Desulfovibrio sp. OttesenSCG-928-G11]|nr:class I SAM-dependent methyltransferase [Desulfovibrio sp. OttesenSCG-928-G11]